MELVVILLCSMSGALVGTSFAILLMYRKIKMPVAEAEPDERLQARLNSSEESLAATVAALEGLRGQLAERARIAQEAGEEVKAKQQQLDLAVAEIEKEAAQRSAAEQKVQELSLQVSSLAEQHVALDGGAGEESGPLSEQTSWKLAAYEARSEEERLKIQKLTEQVAGLTAESAEFKQLAAAQSEAEQLKIQELTEQVAHLTAESAQLKQLAAAQAEAETLKSRELTGQVARLTAELSELRFACEQEGSQRSSAEARLSAELIRNEALSCQLADLESERSQFDLRLQEEKQSAAKGMELLLMAQENLSRVLKPRPVDAPNGKATNGKNGHEVFEVVRVTGEGQNGAVEDVQPVSSPN